MSLFKRRGVMAIWLLLVAMACLKSQVALAVDDDESLRERFKKEYPAAVRRIQETYGRARMKAIIALEPPRGGTDSSVIGVEFAIRDDLLRIASAPVFVAPMENRSWAEKFVVVANPRLSFGLRPADKDSDSPAGVWRISATDPFRDYQYRIRQDFRGFFAPYLENAQTIEEVAAKPGFVITAFESISVDGRKLARMWWRARRDEAKDTVAQGWYLFDPEACWVLRGYRFGRVPITYPLSTDSPGAQYVSHTYEGTHGGVPLLKSTVFGLKSAKGPEFSFEERWDISSFEVTEVPAEEFTLASFGLADPSPRKSLSVAEFKARYAEGSKELVGRFKNLRLRGHLNSFDSLGEVEFRQLGDTCLRVVQRDANRAIERPDLPKRNAAVVRYGPDCDFRLVKKEGAAAYELTHFLKSPSTLPKRDLERRIAEQEFRIIQFTRAPIAFYGKTLAAWLESDDLKILSIHSINPGTPEERVELAFDLKLPSDVKFESGHLVLVPACGWAIELFEVHVTAMAGGESRPLSEGMRATYTSDLSRRTCFPDKLEIYVVDTATGKRSDQRFDMTGVEFDKVSAKELSLAPFGLSEPGK